jgi:KRAB domain-containing zinc finger protein
VFYLLIFLRVGLPFTIPKVISLLQQGEDHWKAEKERLGDSALGGESG